MSLDYFRRGRGLIILAGLAASLLVGAIVLNSDAIRRAFLAFAVVVGFVFAVMSVSARKKSEGLTKEALRRNSLLEQQLQEISASVQEQNRLVEREALSMLEVDQSDGDGGEGKFGRSVFAPSAIPASRIIGRPEAHTAGRVAAAQTMESNSSEVLHALLNAGDGAWTRRIELIGSPEYAQALRSVAEVTRISAPHLLGNPSKDTSYLVIDEGQFERGIWAGMLSTQKTSNFLSLLDHISKAVESGAIVIVCPGQSSNHFTDELRQRATVVVSKDSSTWGWENDIHAPVLELLFTKQNFVTGERRLK